MTKVEEYKWILDILLDLKNNYKEHNSRVLEEMIDMIKYRLQILE